MKNNHVDYYDQEELWGNPPAPYQIEVLEDIRDILPSDINNLLDVGCGDGYITSSLPEKIKKIGIDLSLAALSHVPHSKSIGLITDIPFLDNSFDLVMSNDVIEHIPEQDFQNALKELQRVSRKYILITVPFMEDLLAQLTACANCGFIFHINHHQRAFGVKELLNLFDKRFTPRAVVFSGSILGTPETIQPSFRAMLAPAMAWDRSVCPNCGMNLSRAVIDEAYLSPLNHTSWLLSEVDFLSELPNRNECIVLFEKSDQPASVPDTDQSIINISFGGRLPENSPGRFSTNLTIQNCRLTLSLDSAEPIQSERSWLEYQYHEVTYRLSQPIQVTENVFNVPLWFTPRNAPFLSPSNDYRRDLAIATIIRILNHNSTEHNSLGTQMGKIAEDQYEQVNSLLAQLTGLGAKQEQFANELINHREDLSQVSGKLAGTQEELGQVSGQFNIARDHLIRIDGQVSAEKEELSALGLNLDFSKQAISQVNSKIDVSNFGLQNMERDFNEKLAALKMENLHLEANLKRAILIGSLGGLLLLILAILSFLIH